MSQQQIFFGHAQGNVSLIERAARFGLEAADNFFARIGPSRAPDSGSLIAVLFHSLYRDTRQLADPVLAPNQNVTVEDFRRFVGAVLESGCTVISPAQLDAGLEPGRNYAMITFDDGYFNNTLALDVLDEFEVPATFFISSNHVLQNKAFWWDAFSRELAKAGASGRTRHTEITRIKAWAGSDVEHFLRERFGKLALKPRGDLDRPFMVRELVDFARNKWVHLGNHTCDHAILTRCGAHEMAQQVYGCQLALERIAGKAPVAIAYPNGNFSPAAIEASLEAGLRIGFTTCPRRNRLALDGCVQRMALGRFLFKGGEDARSQFRKFNAGFVPSNVLKTLLRAH